MRRMDRYNDDNNVKQKRSEKNKELYQNINNKYTNITDVTNANVYEINSNVDSKRSSRQQYQQMKKYNNPTTISKGKKELDDFKYLYQQKERKVYDINSVLEEARKNKQEEDILDEKRKLKHTSYNILAGMNLEELLKYREEKKNREITEEEQEIRELVDTIASKTLAGEIDKETTVDLLSDLMATNMLDKVEKADDLGNDSTEDYSSDDTPSTEEIQNEIDSKKDENIEETGELKGADKDFYTRSMDLSEEDFEMDNEFNERKLPFIVKLLLFIILIAIIAVAAYFIYQKI